MKSHGCRDHAPQITLDKTRIVGCTCGWSTPPGTTDSDDAYAVHYAIGQLVDGKEGQMTKKPSKSAFTGCKVFVATMFAQRQTLGETVTTWLEDAQARRPRFQLVDVVVRQSSDDAFHCLSITIFFNEDLAVTKIPKEKPRG